LTDADLRGAFLEYSNLTGARLCKADLRNAKLSGVDLTGANVWDAHIKTKDPILLTKITKELERIHAELNKSK
jgi:uncharacterized protein YjbI with pentapeptide repeats